MSQPKEVAILVAVLERQDSNDTCTDGCENGIHSRANTRKYEENYTRIFGTPSPKKEELN